jgi:N-acetylmuramoyl-L-alanine amidase
MFANNSYAHLYISIHHNAPSAAAVVTEVLYQDSDEGIDNSILSNVLAAGLPDPRIDNATRISKSKTLAKILADNISSSIVFNNRGSKEQDLYVCRNTVMPAVLIECGFLTNEDELKKLIDEGTQLTTARAIAISVDKYFGK